MGRVDKFKRWPVWRSIFGDTWRAAIDDMQFVKGWGLMVPALLFAIYVVLVWQFVGIDQANGEIRDKLLVIAAPLLALPICFLIRMALVIPDREIDLGVRVKKLRKRLTPRYEIGVTRQTFALHVGQQDFLCLTVKNLSDSSSDICSAHLIELRCDNGNSILDAVELQWPGVGTDSYFGSIASLATKTVKVFQVLAEGLQFNLAAMPAQYKNLLEGAKILTGKIGFEDRYWGGQYVYFVAHADNPRIDIVQTEAFSVPYTKDIEDAEFGA